MFENSCFQAARTGALVEQAASSQPSQITLHKAMLEIWWGHQLPHNLYPAL